MRVDKDMYIKILRSKEYAPYLLFGPDSVVAINYKALPKDHYLDLCGDSVDGYLLCLKLNEHKDDLITVEMA